MPSDLAGIIEVLFGPNNRPQSKPHFRLRQSRPGTGAPAAVSYAPPQVAEAYDFPASVTGVGQCIGIVELGGGYKPSDLDSFFSNLGMATPPVAALSVDGASNSPTGDSGGPDGEVELDIEVAGSVAPGRANRRLFRA